MTGSYDMSFYIKNPKGHTWALNTWGGVDIFAFYEDDHNGPVCTYCGYSFCEHCIDEDTMEPCVTSKPVEYIPEHEE